MKKVGFIFYSILLILMVPALLLIASYVEDAYFPVIKVELINISHNKINNMSYLRFQIHGFKDRNCRLKHIDVYWDIDKVIKDDVLYVDSGGVYTFSLNVQKGEEFTTIPLNAKLQGEIPPNTTLNLYYAYRCHAFYDNHLTLTLLVPKKE